MCMAGMTEGPKIIGQNIINYNKLLVSNLYFWGKALGAHPPFPPSSAGSYGYQRECENEQAKVIYMHIWPLSFHNSFMYHMCAAHVICKYQLQPFKKKKKNK